MIEKLIVAGIVLAAALWLARRWWPSLVCRRATATATKAGVSTCGRSDCNCCH